MTLPNKWNDPYLICHLQFGCVLDLDMVLGFYTRMEKRKVRRNLSYEGIAGQKRALMMQVVWLVGVGFEVFKEKEVLTVRFVETVESETSNLQGIPLKRGHLATVLLFYYFIV